jgi:hypothetical protein
LTSRSSRRRSTTGGWPARTTEIARLGLIALLVAATVLPGCGEEDENPAAPGIAGVCKRVPRKAATPVRAARPVENGQAVRAVYWGSVRARPCFFRARVARGRDELRLFAAAPRPPSKKRRGWCAQAPLPPRLQGRVLRLIREGGAKPLGPGGRRILVAGRRCVPIPVVGWPRRTARVSRPGG